VLIGLKLLCHPDQEKKETNQAKFSR